MELFHILIASFLVMLVSLAGVLTIWRGFGSWFERNLPYLVSFSAGVFLVVSFDLLKETFELSPSQSSAVIAVIAGVIVVYLGVKFFPDSHHHHEHELEHEHESAPFAHIHPHTKDGARRMMIGDAFHNAADGILLAPAFLVSTEIGIIATVGILVHEFVQELSEFFVLREAGYSVREALKWNFLVSSTVVIGALIGFFVVSLTSLAGILIGVTAGGFLYIVSLDLIPKSFRGRQSLKKIALHIVAIILGVAAILGVNQITIAGEDTHGHGEEARPHERE